MGLGWFFLGLAGLGVFLPLLPTTPFVLLTAACFARGSQRWHAWLLKNRVFGPILRDWHQGGAISLQAKVLAALMLISLLGWQVGFAPRPFPLKVFLVLLGVSVLAFLFSRPSEPAGVETGLRRAEWVEGEGDPDSCGMAPERRP
jgi:uncharacterized membrane protein YbaN (DUF454 family)